MFTSRVSALAGAIFLTLGLVTALAEASSNKIGLPAIAAEPLAANRLIVSDDRVYPSAVIADFNSAQTDSHPTTAIASDGGKIAVAGSGPAFVVVFGSLLLSLGAFRLPRGLARAARARLPSR
jgi:hypothetical protein